MCVKFRKSTVDLNRAITTVADAALESDGCLGLSLSTRDTAIVFNWDVTHYQPRNSKSLGTVNLTLRGCALSAQNVYCNTLYIVRTQSEIFFTLMKIMFTFHETFSR